MDEEVLEVDVADDLKQAVDRQAADAAGAPSLSWSHTCRGGPS
jgi:hypothetical protein